MFLTLSLSIRSQENTLILLAHLESHIQVTGFGTDILVRQVMEFRGSINVAAPDVMSVVSALVSYLDMLLHLL
jgi:hypothetical protein